jgi:hypothetical protein
MPATTAARTTTAAHIIMAAATITVAAATITVAAAITTEAAAITTEAAVIITAGVAATIMEAGEATITEGAVITTVEGAITEEAATIAVSQRSPDRSVAIACRLQQRRQGPRRPRPVCGRLPGRATRSAELSGPTMALLNNVAGGKRRATVPRGAGKGAGA